MALKFSFAESIKATALVTYGVAIEVPLQDDIAWFKL